MNQREEIAKKYKELLDVINSCSECAKKIPILVDWHISEITAAEKRAMVDAIDKLLAVAPDWEYDDLILQKEIYEKEIAANSELGNLPKPTREG